MNFVTRILIAGTFACLATGASAHQVWLEADGPSVQLRYGEFGENLRETSPGLLDRIEPVARSLSQTGERTLTVTKGADGFTLGGEIAADDSIVAEDSRFPIIVRTRNGTTTRSLWWPAARYVTDRSAVKPVLALDVVPTGENRFQVVFKGKPLAKAKVEVIAAFGWSKELATADDGSFEIELPWRGAYAIEVQHTDRSAGKRGDETYDVASYVTTLTLARTRGVEMPSLPAGGKPR
jgi:hypothetical protein